MSRLWDVVLVPEAFTAEQCREIRTVMETVPLVPATIKDGESSAARVSDVRFVEYDPALWIFARLRAVVEQVNPQTFRFALSPHLEEGFQFTEYREGGFYSWHSDIGAGNAERRKLSLVVQLNDDYEGGELDFFPARFNVPRQAGLLIAFPSYMPHCVRPVSSGVRHTLVSWVSGFSPFA